MTLNGVIMAVILHTAFGSFVDLLRYSGWS